jgi:anti-anti-sigma factor
MLMDNYLDRLVYSRRGNRLMMVRRREAGVPAPAAAAEPVAPVEAPPMLEFEFEEELAVSAVAAPAVLVAPPPTETPAGVARVTTQGDVAVVEVLEERLSDQNVDRFREAMEDAMRRHSKVLVDMSRVSYISSVILGAYARLIRDAQTRKGMLKVCGAGPMVTEVFRSMRFDRLLDLQPDAPSALARMRTT